MSYRPQYKNDQQQMVDLPLDAETVKGQAINSSAVANTIPVRDGNGNVKTNTPISDTDAANKAYVDSKKVQIFRYNGFISYESGSDYALDIGNVVTDGRTVQIGDIIINSELVGGYVTRRDDTFIFIKVVFNGNAYSLNGKNASDFTPADYSYSKADSDNKYATKSEVNAKYTKPAGGIPKSDLAQAVQTSLGKADTALQSAPVTSVAGKTGAVTLVKSDVGLSNVDNVKQYSASNPPPYPVTSVNGKTGAVTLSAADVGAATITQVNETSMVPDSGNSTNLTVPESGGRVEIDVDGWLCVNVSRTTANGQYITMVVQKEDGTDKWGCVNKSTTYFQNNYPAEFLPVKKGDYVRISYNIRPSRIQLIRSKQV